MTQISRPIQIALAALVVFIAVWFIALRGHSSGGESSSSSASAPTASSPASQPAAAPSAGAQSSASQSAPGGGTPASKAGTYHGSAPGVAGLSRAIQRAQGAVAQSQQNAQQLQQKSAEASAEGQAQGAQGQTQNRQAQSGQQAQNKSSQSKSAGANGAGGKLAKPATGAPAMQAAVEGELAQGKVVAVLFWNPSGAVDATVRRELRAAGHAQHGKLAVHVARANEVGSFGSFTHTVQIYSTPTILLINAKGKTSSVTGLTDVFSIEQAIKEVRKAK